MAIQLIQVDNAQVVRNLRVMAGRHWPWALTKTLTDVAANSVQNLRAVTNVTFNLRTQFVPKGIRYRPARFAQVKTGTGTSEVYTAPRISTFMPDHEGGALRTPSTKSMRKSGTDEGRQMVVPGQDLQKLSYKTGAGAVRKRYLPAQLLRRYNTLRPPEQNAAGTKGSGLTMAKNPFVVRSRTGQLMIVRRRGRKAYGLKVLYLFTDNIRIQARWGFEDIVDTTVQQDFTRVLRRNIIESFLF
jgi:hypothetical protein